MRKIFSSLNKTSSPHQDQKIRKKWKKLFSSQKNWKFEIREKWKKLFSLQKNWKFEIREKWKKLFAEKLKIWNSKEIKKLFRRKIENLKFDRNEKNYLKISLSQKFHPEKKSMVQSPRQGCFWKVLFRESVRMGHENDVISRVNS